MVPLVLRLDCMGRREIKNSGPLCRFDLIYFSGPCAGLGFFRLPRLRRHVSNSTRFTDKAGEGKREEREGLEKKGLERRRVSA